MLTFKEDIIDAHHICVISKLHLMKHVALPLRLILYPLKIEHTSVIDNV